MLLGVFIAVVSLGALAWWIYAQFHVSTDDAYVNANVVQISPQVKGQVIQLDIVNNQPIRKGDLLFALDPAFYQAAVANAEAMLAKAEAETSIARITDERTRALVVKHAASSQEGDIADARLKSAEAAQRIAEAGLATARLNLAYTRVSAPVSGWVTNLTLRTGDVVAAGRPLFAIVSNEEYWIDANFRETDLYRIHPGQSALIRVDMYPDHTFHGEVKSISSGSGSAFSLLPPENATGNWVKVTQRVPVRVRVLDTDPNYPLRIGTSVTVTLSTRPGAHQK